MSKKEYGKFVPPSVIKRIEHNREKQKNEILTKLQTIYSYAALKPHECEWILQVIDYIKEEDE